MRDTLRHLTACGQARSYSKSEWKSSARQFRWESKHHVSQPSYWMTKLDLLNLLLSL